MFLWLGILLLVRTEELCVPEAHAIDAFKCFLNSLHLMLHYNCLFSMLLQLKGLLCFQMIQNISQMSDCVQLYLLKLMLPGFEGCGLPVYPRAMALYPPNLDGPPFLLVPSTLGSDPYMYGCYVG